MTRYSVFLFPIFHIIVIVHLHVQQVFSFSAGVPPLPKVCRSLTPQHGNYTPQVSEAPFLIVAEPMIVASGDVVTVTLKSTSDVKFKGFYIQGRGESGNPIGTFRTNKFTETHSCGGVRWNGAHHSNGKEEKDIVLIKWETPKNYEGEISFIGSFVQNYVTIWTGVYADPITIIARNETIEAGNNIRGGIRILKPTQIKTQFVASISKFLGRIFRPPKFLLLLGRNSTRT